MMNDRFVLFRLAIRLSSIVVLAMTLIILLITLIEIFPQGDLVAFMYSKDTHAFVTGDRSSDWNIHLLELRMGLHVRLTNYPRWDRYPAWSPDSQFIAFHSDRTGTHDIYLINMDHGEITPLNIVPPYAQNDEAMVAWSPDNEFIAFHSGLVMAGTFDDQFDIYVSGHNVNDVRKIAPAPGISYAAAWSPDSNHLIYASTRGRSPSGQTCLATSLYTLDVNTIFSTLLVLQRNPLQRLTWEVGDASSSFPAWSPNGETIAYEFTAACQAQHDIYTVQVDGTDEFNITNTPFFDEMHPEWLSDDTQILFTSNQDGDFDLYIMNSDGSNRRQLTNLPGDELAPAWRPTN